MIENAGSLRLANESLLKLPGFVIVAASGTDGFESDETADQWVFGKIDDAHRSLAELADDLVTAELH